MVFGECSAPRGWVALGYVGRDSAKERVIKQSMTADKEHHVESFCFNYAGRTRRNKVTGEAPTCR